MIAFACPSWPAGRCGFLGLCHRAASFTYFGEVLRCPHKCIVTITKVYIARNNIHVELIRFRKNSDFIDIGNFEVGIRPYSFATVVFTKLGSMLSGTSRHCSVLVAPDVSGHDHIATRHFGTYSIRNTSGSVIYRDKHDSGLHNCTISSYYAQAVRTESRSKRQFGSN